MRHWSMRDGRLLPAAAFLGALVTYLATLAPGVVGGDSGEMQFVPHVLGIAHWTGYPLYTMFGKLWEILVPLGSVAHRMNLLSAVASAAAVAVTCLAGRRLAVSWPAGLLGAFVLGTSPLFWNWAIVAGVRSVTVFFAILNLALALEWGHTTRQQRPSADRLLLALAVVFGLSLAHHRTTIFLLPGLAVYIVWMAPAVIRKWRLWLPALALALGIPVLLYLYIPLRSAMNPPYAILEAHSVRGFLALVVAPNLARGMAAPLALADLPPRVIDAVRQIGQQFTWPLFALGVVGAVACLVRRTREAFLLLPPFLLSIVFTVSYNPDSTELNIAYLLPAYLVFSLFIAYGGVTLAMLSRGNDRKSRAIAGLLIAAVAVYVAVYPARLTWQSIRSLDTAPLDAYRTELRGPQAERFLERSLPFLPDGAVLIGDWEQLTPFWYSELVDQSIHNVVYHYPVELDWQAWVKEARQANRPVFLTRRSDQLIGQRFLSAVGPLVELRSTPSSSVPDGVTPQNTAFGDQIELLGYRYSGLDGSTLRKNTVPSIELFWTALRPLSADYSVSVRMVGEQARVISSVDNVHPVLSMYPTSLWQPGEVVGDYYELSFPPAPATGDCHVEIVVYAREGGGFRTLRVQDNGQTTESLALPELTVK